MKFVLYSLRFWGMKRDTTRASKILKELEGQVRPRVIARYYSHDVTEEQLEREAEEAQAKGITLKQHVCSVKWGDEPEAPGMV